MKHLYWIFLLTLVFVLPFQGCQKDELINDDLSQGPKVMQRSVSGQTCDRDEALRLAAESNGYIRMMGALEYVVYADSWGHWLDRGLTWVYDWPDAPMYKWGSSSYTVDTDDLVNWYSYPGYEPSEEEWLANYNEAYEWLIEDHANFFIYELTQIACDELINPAFITELIHKGVESLTPGQISRDRVYPVPDYNLNPLPSVPSYNFPSKLYSAYVSSPPTPEPDDPSPSPVSPPSKPKIPGGGGGHPGGDPIPLKSNQGDEAVLSSSTRSISISTRQGRVLSPGAMTILERMQRVSLGSYTYDSLGQSENWLSLFEHEIGVGVSSRSDQYLCDVCMNDKCKPSLAVCEEEKGWELAEGLAETAATSVLAGKLGAGAGTVAVPGIGTVSAGVAAFVGTGLIGTGFSVVRFIRGRAGCITEYEICCHNNCEDVCGC